MRILARLNAVELRNVQFVADAERLTGKIGEVLKRPTLATKRKYVVMLGLLLLLPLTWLISFFVPLTSLWRSQSVESCGLVGPIEFGQKFSGVYGGVIVDSTSASAEVQLMLVREDRSVKGTYLRGGICGTVTGEVAEDEMNFRWRWSGSSGRGRATQIGDNLSGTSGFNDATEGGGRSFACLESDTMKSGDLNRPSPIRRGVPKGSIGNRL